MVSYFQRLRCSEWFEEAESRNAIVSVISGILVGWWIILDVAARYPSGEEFYHAYYTCGVLGTLAFIMVNTINNQQLNSDDYSFTSFGSRWGKIWLFVGFVLGFCSLIAASWILFGSYIIPGKEPQWPGLAVFFQCLFIFIAALVYKFGRREDMWS